VTAAVVEALILELLQWLAKRERSYEEVMDAWRTSCPRLPIWEEVNDRGLVIREEVERVLYRQGYVIGACPSSAAQIFSLQIRRFP
jgi:hypothetical protein